MKKFKFSLPEDFDENEWEFEKKGFYENSLLIIEEKKYQILFFDKQRLAQEIEDELNSSNAFLEKNLVVINSVTRKNMELAVEKIMSDGRYLSLMSE